MRLSWLVLLVFVFGCDAPADKAADAYIATQQAAHVAGHCGKGMQPGTGLTDFGDGVRRGWVLSMMTGEHRFRVRGAGAVTLSPIATVTAAEFREGMMTFALRMTGTDAKSVLEWKIPGARNWEPVPTAFLYPRVEMNAAQYAIDEAIRTGGLIPETGLTALQMSDQRRVVQPGASALPRDAGDL